MKDGVHGRPHAPPVSAQYLTEEDLRHQRISQQYSPEDQTGTVHRQSEESEPEEEDRGVHQDSFLPPDGVIEEASKEGGREVAQYPTAGCNYQLLESIIVIIFLVLPIQLPSSSVMWKLWNIPRSSCDSV